MILWFELCTLKHCDYSPFQILWTELLIFAVLTSLLPVITIVVNLKLTIILFQGVL